MCVPEAEAGNKNCSLDWQIGVCCSGRCTRLKIRGGGGVAQIFAKILILIWDEYLKERDLKTKKNPFSKNRPAPTLAINLALKCT
jgi:hypothetical protein